MRKLATLTAVAALATFGFGKAVMANHAGDPPEYADSVVNFGRVGQLFSNQPHAAAPQQNTLGQEDATCAQFGWFNLGDQTGDENADPAVQGFVIVQFDDNVLIPDGTGADDLTVWEACSVPSANTDNSQVFVSDDCVNFVFVGNATAAPFDLNGTFANNFDVDGLGVGSVRCVKIVNAFPTIEGGANGVDVDAVEALNSFNLGTAQIEKGTTDTDINITGPTFDAKQSFSYTITLTNTNNEDLSNIIFIDVVPGEFDVDSVTVDNTSADAGDCEVTNLGEVTKTKGNLAKKKQKLAPDFIEITADNLGDGQSCEVTVNVSTDDDHPGRGSNPTWTPTSCPDTTIVLNDGVQVFDDVDTDGAVTSADTLLFVDDDSLELTCVP